MVRHNSEEIPLVQFLDVGVKDWENGKRHEKDEEHVEELHERLFEDGPVWWACINIYARATRFLLLLFTHDLVIAVKFVQRHGEVGVKA